MEGRIDEIIEALQKADYEQKFAALTGQSYTPPRANADED
jgi:peptide chain release factor 1